MTHSPRRLKRAGYTLIELIVAVGLFAIVMTLATGAYLIMINANRVTQGLATGIDNLSFVLDTMTTSMRTGTQFACASTNNVPANCSGGGAVVSFKSQQGCTVSYTRSGNTVVENQSGAGCPTLSNIALTAPAVKVTNLRFYVTGTANTDTYQPYVSIVISGTVETSPGKTKSFNVESSMIMRGTDL